ncbi:MAG: hypothetical protein IJU98_03005 [Synergistaceae bacterium]|nr:hypothetical protein [Synergistaceae bacterium]
MTMISSRFMEGASGGRNWAAIVPITPPASFTPSIEEGQTLDAYAGEVMEDYAVRGSNVEVNIAEAVQLVTDNDSASYFIRA